MPPAATSWPCESCGAALSFDPKSGQLVCGHCGHVQPVPDLPPRDRSRAFVEHDLDSALRGALPPAAMEEVRISRCPGCGAELELGEGVEATTCAFCATPVVPQQVPLRAIRPQAVLPFAVPEREARAAMVTWLGRLWFAPNGLQEYARKGRQLTGIYVPFWTFDAATRSRYAGQRGDAYYETQWVTVEVNGKSERRQQQVRKIRWSRASGWVQRRFDDVLVIGSDSLPRGHTQALAPWDLSALQPHAADYLSGFQAEAYSVPLDQGHVQAREDMAGVIAQDVRAAIGGDEQQIERIDTDWSEETFKHILLPVWTAAYRYGGKSYRFVVNGQSGKVQGERPWSAWKIAGAVVLGLVIAGVLAWLGQQR
ncbi:primosomal protein N' (replication factor Y) - superfamily II helicase [Gemmobacter sp.]|uniref:primosomal protein N' (replication factor Y) - superfamily II helicase n=1 Tax=Gemmobacter sp. TaxID=1898957 RepID=UPI002AFE34E6|nr:primosomal protein N' (replication factor Y) - superfamily II helicase [Gemmobacter sp.]